MTNAHLSSEFSTTPFPLASNQQLDFARVIATVLEDRGLVGRLDPLAVTQGRAAELLGCCTKTISNLRKGGSLDTVMIGKKPHVTMASLRALVAGKAA